MIAFVTSKDGMYISELLSGLTNDTIEYYLDDSDAAALAQKLRACNQYGNILIDVSIFNNSTDEIVQCIYMLRSMLSSKITILAIGYSAGDELLSEIFKLGVYNIITAVDLKDIRTDLEKCVLDTGKTFSQAQKFLLKDEAPKKRGNKTVIKREKMLLKQLVTIGVVGSQRRMGVTTQAIQLVKFLKGLGKKACYIEYNQHDHISTLPKYYQDALYDADNRHITYQEVDLFQSTDNLMGIQKLFQEYEYIVYDYGCMDEIDKNSYLEKDVKIVVAGTNTWEMDALVHVTFPVTEPVEDINYIFSFSPSAEHDDVLEYMENRKEKTYFAVYAPDMFSAPPLSAKESYHRILGDFITDEQERVEDEKGIFHKFFKRGR